MIRDERSKKKEELKEKEEEKGDGGRKNVERNERGGRKTRLLAWLGHLNLPLALPQRQCLSYPLPTVHDFSVPEPNSTIGVTKISSKRPATSMKSIEFIRNSSLSNLPI